MCLDGRLPAGRRALVMQHAAQCGSCGTFWHELQAAQRLTLRLQQPRVSEGFRETLWRRIESGEGTPEAVFREPVPALTKLRYALTGAAAAAAVLLCLTWLAPESERTSVPFASAGSEEGRGEAIAASTAPPAQRRVLHQDGPTLDLNPLLSTAQRLRFQLVAVEAARQLDQRYAATAAGLRRLASPDASDRDVSDVFANAEEFRGFAELLLDMRDRERLLFTDGRVEPDLRFAVGMLERSRLATRNAQTARVMVEPVFRRDHLAATSRSIALVHLEPREEQDLLLHLTTRRPEIFPKLFFVLGSNAEMAHQFGLLQSGSAFWFEDECAPSWVAPRSEVENREGLVRILRGRRTDGSGSVHVEIHVEPRR